MSDDASALPSLYQQAHEAHFIAKDWGRAAKLWDAYLRGPDKRFALEARFNHGVALFRLGQVSEAEAALRPFVDGDYGSYRQEDARRLLQRAKLRVP